MRSGDAMGSVLGQQIVFTASFNLLNEAGGAGSSLIDFSIDSAVRTIQLPLSIFAFYYTLGLLPFVLAHRAWS